MTEILLIAGDSVRALLHRRLLVALIIGMLGLTVVSSLLLNAVLERVQEEGAWVPDSNQSETDEQQARQMRDGLEELGPIFMAGFFWFATLGGAAVAVYTCSAAVSTDIRQGTISVVLAKPVTRAQFLLGKYCGAGIVLCCYSALTGIAMVVFAYANQTDLNLTARYAPWLMFCNNLMMGSVALLLSLFVRPFVAAVIAYFASASFLSSPNPLYFILPSYDRLNVALLIMEGKLIAIEDIFVLTLYAFDVAIIFVLLSLWRFRTREMI